MKNTISLACLALIFGCTLQALATTASPTLEWIEQLGTSSPVYSYDVSADGLGNVYISGFTNGSLKGTNAGGYDAFISKYDSSGILLWTEQIGTSSNDVSNGVSADGLGNVYISGFTKGSLGATNSGDADAFVSKFNASGTLLWTEQIGTSSFDKSEGVSADGLGNVYITGFTSGSIEGTNAGGIDSFVSKYDGSGIHLWTKQFGTSSEDVSSSVSADGLGNVYVTGRTDGGIGGTNAGNFDAFVSKYNANGTLLWAKQLGSNRGDNSYAVSADGVGNVYISGYTGGNLGGTNPGNGDAFVSKYDANGTLLWTEQLGTSSPDVSWGVSADGLGSVYISGSTHGSLDGINAGGADAFVSKYGANGNLLWTEQLSTINDEISRSVSSDGLGSIYISGYISGILEETSVGFTDELGGLQPPGPIFLNAFIAKFSDPIPEPSTLLLGSMAILGLLLRRSR